MTLFDDRKKQKTPGTRVPGKEEKMKTERFILEYANHKVKDIKNNKLMLACIKSQKLERIQKIVAMHKSGLFTVSETIKLLLEA